MSDILMVDDDLATFELLNSIGMGAVRPAHTADNALEMLRRARPRLVVLDVDLGGHDGSTVLQALRSDPSLAGLPVLLLCRPLPPGGPVPPRAAPGLDCLRKPLDVVEFRSRLQLAMSARHARGVAWLTSRRRRAPDLNGAVVLVTAGDPAFFEAIRTALESEGCRLHWAHDLAAADAWAVAHQPDVTFVDLELAGENSLALGGGPIGADWESTFPWIGLARRADDAATSQAAAPGALAVVGTLAPPEAIRAHARRALRHSHACRALMQGVEDHWRQVLADRLTSVGADTCDAVLTIDDRNTVLFANDAARGMLGLPAAPGAPGEVPAALLPALPAAPLDGRVPATGTLTLTLPGRRTRRVAWRRRPSDSDGRLVLTLTLRDLSERARAEMHAKACRKLRAENRSRQLMLSYLAHEIGNPLNGILGLTSQLLAAGADPLSPTQRRYLELVVDSGQVLHQLMHDVIDLTRFQSGGFSVESGKVMLGTLVTSVLDTLRTMAERHGVELVEPDGGLDLTVLADATRLKQCLHNLISNACKYGRPGGQVRVSLHACQHEVEIAISDDGRGLTADQMTRMFHPFERLGRRGPAGHGLGLAVTQMLTEAMNGRLEARSEPNVGSRFAIVLPRAAVIN